MSESGWEFFDREFLARLEQLHLIAKRLSARPAAGRQRSRRMGDGLEFADHRAYAAGDDIRFIDWPYFARMEKLLLRMFHEHSEADVAILLDCSASMAPPGRASGPEKFQYARRAAAALAYVAMGSGQRVILQPFADRPGPRMHTGRNRAQVLEVLTFLRGLSAGGTTDLAGCAEQFARRAAAPAAVLIISDLLDCPRQLADALAQLRLAGHDVTVLHLLSPHDAEPQLAGPVLLRQAETGCEMNLHVSDELLESYRARWDEFTGGCRAACRAREATYVAARTDLPFEKLILHTLRAAGVLGG